MILLGFGGSYRISSHIFLVSLILVTLPFSADLLASRICFTNSGLYPSSAMSSIGTIAKAKKTIYHVHDQVHDKL